VTALEAGLAGLFVLGGIRSMWIWGRRRFEGTDTVDHALYALFVTGRVGLWFAFAGLFAIYATTRATGRAAVDDLAELRWYALVPLVLGAAQLLAGYFLSRRRAAGEDRGGVDDPTSSRSSG
jgi:hypothetical protein